MESLLDQANLDTAFNLSIKIILTEAGASSLGHVWILCRQTHEQAYVSAGKRLCLQANMQTSTWQEASSAAMESP